MGASASKFGQYEANRGGLSPSVVELGAEASGKYTKSSPDCSPALRLTPCV